MPAPRNDLTIMRIYMLAGSLKTARTRVASPLALTKLIVGGAVSARVVADAGLLLADPKVGRSRRRSGT